MKLQQLKVIISGGGTGGHIFPAIAIANAIKKCRPNADFLFVGAKGKMEMEKVPAAGYPIKGLWISGIQRKLTLQNLLFPLKLIYSLIVARKILTQYKPQIVIGTGGFASGPVLKIASNNNIPTLIQEQNSFAGITNKLLGKKVDKICVAYEGMDKFFPKNKILLTGNPVRQDVVDIEGKKEYGLKHFNLSPNNTTILVIGGSLGALTINESINLCIDKIADNNIQLVWQTGKAYFETAKINTKKYSDKGIFCYDFIHQMDLAYAVADIVISRAGASSVSELCLVSKPCILIPSPNVAEDHQTKNAKALVDKNAAILIKDKDARHQLWDKITELISNVDQQKALAENIAKLALNNSADVIAKEALALIETDK